MKAIKYKLYLHCRNGIIIPIGNFESINAAKKYAAEIWRGLYTIKPLKT